MSIESNTARYRAVCRKSVERILHRASDAVVLHLRYAGSDVGTGIANSATSDQEPEG